MEQHHIIQLDWQADKDMTRELAERLQILDTELEDEDGYYEVTSVTVSDFGLVCLATLKWGS